MMTGKMMRGSAPVLLIGLLAACATPAHLQSQGGTGFGTGATGYGAPAAAPYAAPPVQTAPPVAGGIPSSEINSALFGGSAAPAGATPAPLAAPPVLPAAPVAGAVATDPATGAPGISDEQDFQAVSSRETIESDKARIAANKANYQQIAPTALPERTGEAVSPVVAYVLSAPNGLGEAIYDRRATKPETYQKACQRYATAEAAQAAFLKSGGPKRDGKKMDPDGDGYACDFDPTPFRQAAGN
jgi:hypothetical protein